MKLFSELQLTLQLNVKIKVWCDESWFFVMWSIFKISGWHILFSYTVSKHILCMKLFSMGIEQHDSHFNSIFDKGSFSVSSGLVFLRSAWYILGSPWVQWSPDHPIFWRPYKANVLILRFQPAMIPHNPLCSLQFCFHTLVRIRSCFDHSPPLKV